MFYRFVQDPSRRWIQGRYDCEYVKENGKWKFSVLKMRRPWPEFLADTPRESVAHRAERRSHQRSNINEGISFRNFSGGIEKSGK